MNQLEIRFNKSLAEPEEYIDEAVDFIKENVDEEEKAVSALSGGVDSSVVTELFSRAIGDRLYPVHIDTGFMRLIKGREESNIVKDTSDHLENFRFLDRTRRFKEAIFGIEDAEEKRLKFRETYEKVLNEIIKKLNASVGTQGTINRY